MSCLINWKGFDPLTIKEVHRVHWIVNLDTSLLESASFLVGSEIILEGGGGSICLKGGNSAPSPQEAITNPSNSGQVTPMSPTSVFKKSD